MSILKIRSTLSVFIIIVLIILFYFESIRIAGIPITHFVFIAILLFVLVRKNNILGLKNILIIDKINKYQIGILVLIVFTYIIKQGNIADVEYNNLVMTGQKVNYLYYKVALNGIISVFISIFAYNIGKSFNGNYEKMRSVLISIVILCAINGLANIIVWAVTTGGVIARYNFIPPLIPSQGTSIGTSILGFMVALGIFDSKRKLEKLLFYISFPILLLSVIIILSRQPQISFLLKIAIFLLIIQKGTSIKSLIPYILGISSILILVYFFYTSSTEISDNYSDMVSEGSTDIAVRLGPILSAINLFQNNIITGIGYGMFGLYNTTPVYVSGIPLYLASTHNGLAGISSEMGVFGLIINFFLLLDINKKIYYTSTFFKRKNPILLKFTASVFSMTIVSTMLLFVSNYFLYPPPSEYSYISGSFIMWLLIGMITSFDTKTNFN